jgi:hypothetical protein
MLRHSSFSETACGHSGNAATSPSPLQEVGLRPIPLEMPARRRRSQGVARWDFCCNPPHPARLRAHHRRHRHQPLRDLSLSRPDVECSRPIWRHSTRQLHHDRGSWRGHRLFTARHQRGVHHSQSDRHRFQSGVRCFESSVHHSRRRVHHDDREFHHSRRALRHYTGDVHHNWVALRHLLFGVRHSQSGLRRYQGDGSDAQCGWSVSCRGFSGAIRT